MRIIISAILLVKTLLFNEAHGGCLLILLIAAGASEPQGSVQQLVEESLTRRTEAKEIKVYFSDRELFNCKNLLTRQLKATGTFFKDSSYELFKRHEKRLKKLATLKGANSLFVKANIINNTVDVKIYDC